MNRYLISNRGMSTTVAVVVLALILMIAGGLYYYSSLSKDEPKELGGNVLNGAVRVGEMADKFDYSGVLEDVTEGKDVLGGVNTNGEASGIVQVTFVGGAYDLVATFEGLPDPVGTDFYEGWVVRRGLTFNIVSTGRAEKIEGAYINTFQSGLDLIDHTRYVLTIESNDGDPAPSSDHVLEVDLRK